MIWATPWPAAAPDLKMLGGGQPARIPEMNAVWRRRLEELAEEDGGLERALTTYDPPRGNPRFLAGHRRACSATPSAGTSARKTSPSPRAARPRFSFSSTCSPGACRMGAARKILLPLVPEYIGYSDQGVDGCLFRAVPPLIEKTGPHEFKYRVDFDQLGNHPGHRRDLRLAADQSRPATCSPTRRSRVCRHLAKRHDIPLIIDNAYGAPFPGIIFEPATPFWEPHVILTYSLSKIGLPGTRTGIVIGPPEIIRAARLDERHRRPVQSEHRPADHAAADRIRRDPAPQPRGGAAVLSGKMPTRARGRASRPSATTSSGSCTAARARCSCGSGFPACRSPRKELYQRLKQRGVLVIPGEYFFFGLDDAGLGAPRRMHPRVLCHGRGGRPRRPAHHRRGGEGRLLC